MDKVLPLGLVTTRAYLLAKGVGRHALDNAVKSGKLKAICRGVYVREGLPLSWQGVMSSLNMIYGHQSVYLGGLSVLEQSGVNHYLKNDSVIHVYAAFNQPKWLDALDLGGDYNWEFIWRGTKRIWHALNDDDMQRVNWRNDVPGYLQASEEHACLELLAGVPNDLSFEHADALFQGLSTLSPRKLQVVLSQCRSVKAKRLFFWFAQRHGFAWSRYLDVAGFDLGKGKRVIDKNGVLDKALLITVPKDL